VRADSAPADDLSGRRRLQEMLEDRILVEVKLRPLPLRPDRGDGPLRPVRGCVEHRDEIAVDHHRRAIHHVDG
jgi:hypothetical protein